MNSSALRRRHLQPTALLLIKYDNQQQCGAAWREHCQQAGGVMRPQYDHRSGLNASSFGASLGNSIITDARMPRVLPTGDGESRSARHQSATRGNFRLQRRSDLSLFRRARIAINQGNGCVVAAG